MDSVAGEPLSGVSSDTLANAELPRLDEDAEQATEARVEEDMHVGGTRPSSSSAAAGAASRCGSGCSAALMDALTGRQEAAALAAYQAIRRISWSASWHRAGPELKRCTGQCCGRAGGGRRGRAAADVDGRDEGGRPGRGTTPVARGYGTR